MILSAEIAQAAAELAHAAAATDPGELAALSTALTMAKRIVTYGCGREGLMLRALTMRLYHLGLDAHVMGDMACPPVGPGDLLLTSCGPGSLSTVAALIAQAKTAGAITACITAQPMGPDPIACDLILTIPAQTMANDQTATAALLPMGSVFEGAQYLIFEILVLHLSRVLHQSPAQLRARHTNLE